MEVEDGACQSQTEAVEQVRSDMLTLNSIVVSELEKFNLNVQSHPPHAWARNLGPNFDGSLEDFYLRQSEPSFTYPLVMLLTLMENDRFGILSGDDLVARLSLELPDIESLIFAMGGVDGLLRVPPHVASEDDLIRRMVARG